MPRYLAIDTETTGLEILHGRRPFLFTTWAEERPEGAPHLRIHKSVRRYLSHLPDSALGYSRNWEAPVNPTTRTPVWEDEDLDSFCDYAEGSTPVFYHAFYEFYAFASVGIGFKFPNWAYDTATTLRSNLTNPLLIPEPTRIITCPRFWELQIVAALINNKGPGDLKTLAMHWLGISESDQKHLQSIVTKARAMARSQKPDWKLGIGPDGSNEPKADYWLPKALFSDPDIKSCPREWNTICDTYGSIDAYRTLSCFVYARHMMKRLSGTPEYSYAIHEQYDAQHDAMEPLYALQSRGMNLLPGEVAKLSDLFFETSAQLKCVNDITMSKALNRSASCTSPNDLIEYLHDFHKLPVISRTENNGQPSTNRKTLYAHRQRALNQIHNRPTDVPSPFSSEKVDKPRQLVAFLDRQISYSVDEDGASKNNVGYKSYATGAGYLRNYLNRAIPRTGQFYCSVPSSPHADGYTVAGYFHKPFQDRWGGSELTLYPSYKQTGTAWTRFSSKDPNGQNVSKKAEIPLRKAFGPPPGFIWAAIDYSQLEIRLFARAANALEMLEALSQGLDVHSFTAAHVYGIDPDEVTSLQRRAAKAINFGIIYGMGREKLMASCDDPNFMDLYMEKFPSVSKFMWKTIKEVEKTGSVDTLYGRRLIVSPDPAYKGPNGVIQGTAGEHVRNAMVDIYNCFYRPKSHWSYAGVKMIANFHDELLFEIPIPENDKADNISKIIYKIMVLMSGQGGKINVNTPVDCKIITTNWAEGIAFSDTEAWTANL